MSAVSAALAYQRLILDDAVVAFLRATNAPVIAGVLREHLGTPGQRVNTEELHELVDADLAELRDHFHLGKTTAKGYCDQWRDAGFIVRRPDPQTRSETYEMAAAGHDAIRILDQLEKPTSTVTESRLRVLTTALHQLAIDTDPDVERRIIALKREQARLAQEISELQAGDIPALDDRRARERVSDIVQQSRALPADFARVRARFEELNRDLRATIVASAEPPNQILDDIFRGVDMIGTSDEGQTFTAFAALARDPERQAAFEDDVQVLLGRDFAATLPHSERRAIRLLMREMKSGSRDVQEALTDFARGLRRYVYSQEFRSDRVMNDLIKEATTQAVDAARFVLPFEAVDAELELSTMRMLSLGVIEPYDPSDFSPLAPLSDHDPVAIDFAVLEANARETEIDFAELRRSVNDSFDEYRDLSELSVMMVLKAFPASQGIASVIGLLSLAATEGRIDWDNTETLEWSGVDGVERSAEVPRHVFMERLK